MRQRQQVLGRLAALCALALLAFTACGGPTADGGAAPGSQVAQPAVAAEQRCAAAAEPRRRPAEDRGKPAQAIARWLSTDGRIAHRGGSAHWPEMSRYAYDSALRAGYQALEITLARTSDGVWFGLHDRFLDRTSGTSDLRAAESTWAEVQQHRINAESGVLAHQPYLRLTDFLKAYYGRAVLFVDSKESETHADELLDILDALPGDATGSVVAKHVWSSGRTSWLEEANERGYTTWRAFGRKADFERHHHGADLLGMSYKANACVWRSIKALGKPVIAHIVPTDRAAQKALRKGADALMVSGVTEVAPRFVG